MISKRDDRSKAPVGQRETLAERAARAAKREPGELFKTRTPRAGSIPAWVSGAAVLLLAAASPFLFCSPKKSSLDKRREVFVEVATLVNPLITDLKPFHAKILPSAQSEVMFLDEQIKACVAAEPLVERLSRASLPPDEAGRALSSGDGLREAASGFEAGLAECRAGGAAPENVSKCLLRCMRDWAALVRAVDQMRKEADWVGVRVESIAPLTKRGSAELGIRERPPG